MSIIFASAEQDFSTLLDAKIQRISRLLTQQEIARIAGVSQEDVDLFEHRQPMDSVVREKLLKLYGFGGKIDNPGR